MFTVLSTDPAEISNVLEIPQGWWPGVYGSSVGVFRIAADRTITFFHPDGNSPSMENQDIEELIFVSSEGQQIF